MIKNAEKETKPKKKYDVSPIPKSILANANQSQMSLKAFSKQLIMSKQKHEVPISMIRKTSSQISSSAFNKNE